MLNEEKRELCRQFTQMPDAALDGVLRLIMVSESLSRASEIALQQLRLSTWRAVQEYVHAWRQNVSEHANLHNEEGQQVREDNIFKELLPAQKYL